MADEHSVEVVDRVENCRKVAAAEEWVASERSSLAADRVVFLADRIVFATGMAVKEAIEDLSTPLFYIFFQILINFFSHIFFCRMPKVLQLNYIKLVGNHFWHSPGRPILLFYSMVHI